MRKSYFLDEKSKITIHFSEALEEQVNWLLDIIQKFYSEETPFSDGTTIQVGWSVLTLKQERSNEFVIYEPDFKTNPLANIVKGADVTLSVLVQQRDLLKQTGAEGLECRFSDKIVFAKGCLSTTKVYMERVETSTLGDSGWFVGYVDEDQNREEYEAIQAYELLRIRPGIMQALLLPTRFLVVFEDSEVEAILNQDGENLWVS